MRYFYSILGAILILAKSNTAFAQQAPSPVFSKPAGFYGATQLQISCPAEYEVRYTINGDSVMATSTLLTGSIYLGKNTVVKARCFKTGNPNNYGPITTQTYLINEATELPVVSLSTRPRHLWDINEGIYAEGPNLQSDCPQYPYYCANFWQGWEKPAYFEYFNEDGAREVAQHASIEITGGWSKASPKKGILVDFGHDDFGDGKVEDWPLMPDKPHLLTWNKIHLRAGGNGQNSQFGHDAWIQRTVAKNNPNLDYMAYRPAVLLINGEYWGVYEIRERQDKHYIRHNYGYDKDSVDLLRFPPGYDRDPLSTTSYSIKAGSDSIWKIAHRRLRDANPTSNQFYDLFDQYFDLDNYIDYYAVQTFIGNNDWLGPWFNNIRVWRPQVEGGKWRYMLWDLDGSMGEQWDPKYTTCFDNVAYARQPDYPAIEHNWLFDLACRNPKFKNRFEARYAHLINALFRKETFDATAKAMVFELDGELERNFFRWNFGNLGEWVNRFSYCSNWADYRRLCAAQHISNAMNRTGVFSLGAEVMPKEAAQLFVDSLLIEDSSWRGIYFRSQPIKIRLEPQNGWQFSHWESSGTPIEAETLLSVEQKFSKNTFLTAQFIPKDPVRSFENGVALFPNPTAGWLYVQSETPMHTLTFTDALGRVVLRLDLGGNNLASFKLDGLANGVYIVSNGDWYQKIFVTSAEN
jgi:hypothetical protein